MTGTKVLVGTFCLVCLIILLSVWGATQWTAVGFFGLRRRKFPALFRAPRDNSSCTFDGISDNSLDLTSSASRRNP